MILFRPKNKNRNLTERYHFFLPPRSVTEKKEDTRYDENFQHFC